MRTMLLALLPLVSFAGTFAATAASAATWTVVSPVGGDGAALAARAPSGAVYAIPGDRLSLFRTDDRGGHWIKVTLPVPPSPSLPLAIAAAADGVYLDYQRGNVARSTDGGATWTFRKLPGTSERIVPGPGSRIYVVLDRRLHASDDGLATVRRLSNTDIDALAIDPRGGLWAITGRGASRRLRHSADGRTWTAGRVIPERRQGEAGLRAARDGTVYATFGAFRTFRTRNQGRTWTRLSDHVLGLGPGSLVYGTAQRDRPVPDPGLTVSRDRGTTWTHPADQRARASLSLVVPLAGDDLLVATGAGIIRSDDGGRHFTRADEGFGHARATAIAETRQGVALIGYERGLACCVGGAFTFRLPPGGEPPLFMAADRSTGVVYTDRGSTRDLGAHWRRYAANPLAAGGGRVWAVRGVEQFRRRELLTGTGTGPLRVVKRRLTVRESPVSMVVVPGALVAVGADGRVRRSTNGGRTWVTRPAGAPACASHIAADGNVVYVDGGAYPCPERTGQRGVWRSLDGGLHWAKTASVTGTHVAAGAGRVAVADQGSVRVSANGATWDLLPALPDSATVAALLLPTDGSLLVLDDNGLIWREG